MVNQSLAYAAGEVLRSTIVLPESPIPSPTENHQKSPGMLRTDLRAYRHHHAKKSKHEPRLEVIAEPLDHHKLDRTCLEVLKLEEVKNLLRQNSPHASRLQSSPDILKLTQPQLFRSLAICDNTVTSYTVRLRSKFFSLGPRGLKLGAFEFLDPAESKQQECFLEISPRPGPNRRPVFVLEYGNMLISQGRGDASLVLAAQMDVTKAFQEFTSALFRERQRVKAEEVKSAEKGSIYLHPNANLGDSGICIAEGNDQNTEEVEIDWTNLDDVPTSCAPKSKECRLPADDRLPAHLISHLNQLVQHVLTQHERAFVLSPGSGPEWQITYTSPALHSRVGDLQVAFSRTNRDTLIELGTALAGDKSVKLRVQWGEESKDALLIAEPMLMGEEIGCWLCFLVD